MSAALNLEGVRFGRLVALRRVGAYRSNGVPWVCICDCGTETIVLANHLRRGITRSCGCLQRDAARVSGRTNGRLRAGRSYPHLCQATVTYQGAHSRVRRARGRAAEQMCPCGKPAEQWSYDHSDPEERTEMVTSKWSTVTLAYSLDPVHYEALCKPCHRQIDAAHRIGVLACL